MSCPPFEFCPKQTWLYRLPMAHMAAHSMMGADGGSQKQTQAPVASPSTKPEAACQGSEARLPAALLTAPEPNNGLSRYEASRRG